MESRHAFSVLEVSEPEACKTCHMGFDHAKWEMYSGAKHGVTYLINRDVDPQNKDRAPRCQTCHMPEGNHRVFSAWGFLAVRLPEDDAEWMGYRATILKGLGVLDPADGKIFNLLEYRDGVYRDSHGHGVPYGQRRVFEGLPGNEKVQRHPGIHCGSNTVAIVGQLKENARQMVNLRAVTVALMQLDF
ncbi:MAG: hypothetical protein K9N21_16525 [Deltaproteobacteria bacterium]|nr:hypothetical protein [Deltaproteobacteria bacterium]